MTAPARAGSAVEAAEDAGYGPGLRARALPPSSLAHSPSTSRATSDGSSIAARRAGGGQTVSGARLPEGQRYRPATEGKARKLRRAAPGPFRRNPPQPVHPLPGPPAGPARRSGRCAADVAREALPPLPEGGPALNPRPEVRGPPGGERGRSAGPARAVGFGGALGGGDGGRGYCGAANSSPPYVWLRF